MQIQGTQSPSASDPVKSFYPVDEDPGLRCPRIREGEEANALHIMLTQAHALSKATGTTLIKGALASPENHQPHWALHISSLPHFVASMTAMKEQLEFLFYEELVLDENLLHQLSREVGLISQEEVIAPGFTKDVGRILHALRSRRGSLVSATLYGFMRDGKMFFCRWETLLSSFAQFPEKLLEPESVHWIRKLRNTDELPHGLN